MESSNRVGFVRQLGLNEGAAISTVIGCQLLTALVNLLHPLGYGKISRLCGFGGGLPGVKRCASGLAAVSPSLRWMLGYRGTPRSAGHARWSTPRWRLQSLTLWGAVSPSSGGRQDKDPLAQF